MDIIINKPPVGGTVQAIVSKSAAHRIMIAAALSGLPLTQNLDGLSLDITATKQCLEALLSEDRGDAPASLCCGESGSTLRFLLPVAEHWGSTQTFTVKDGCRTGPWARFWKHWGSMDVQFPAAHPNRSAESFSPELTICRVTYRPSM